MVQLDHAITVVPKSDYAIITAMAGDLRVTVGSQTRALTDEERQELVAKHLSNYLATGQRAGALGPLMGNSLSANGDLGFRAAIWMEETTDAAGKVQHIMRSTVEGVSPDVARQINQQLAMLMSGAVTRGQDISFESYIQQRSGNLINGLYRLSVEQELAYNKMAGPTH
ncbi:MAG: hypothetical protein M9920_09970 [Verrucomicrobiae bacterium]|nr:hypothetical protein [Verrucomicrobiae bacterium]